MQESAYFEPEFKRLFVRSIVWFCVGWLVYFASVLAIIVLAIIFLVPHDNGAAAAGYAFFAAYMAQGPLVVTLWAGVAKAIGVPRVVAIAWAVSILAFYALRFLFLQAGQIPEFPTITD